MGDILPIESRHGNCMSLVIFLLLGSKKRVGLENCASGFLANNFNPERADEMFFFAFYLANHFDACRGKEAHNGAEWGSS
jgi:hypothetical protein